MSRNSANLLRAARAQKLAGFNLFKQAFSEIWSIIIHNLAVEAELSDEQVAKLCRIREEIDRVLTFHPEMELTPEEYSEYIARTADEVKDRLLHIWS